MGIDLIFQEKKPSTSRIGKVNAFLLNTSQNHKANELLPSEGIIHLL
jgi:hypothetical protein